MLHQPYLSFRRKLESAAQEKRIPLRALFELTYRCNFDCLHCYIPQRLRKQELNTKRVFSLLEQLRDLGCFHLGFTGGEIFLRKDIFPILWQAKRLGFNLTILTNGYYIDKRKAGELQEIAPIKVDITLHSLDPVRFENITRVKGSFNKVMIAIDLLHERGIPLGIKNCVLRENRDELGSIAKFAADIGASARIGAKVFAPPEKNLCPPAEDDLTSLQINAVANFKKRKVFTCATGKTALTISPAGELKLCPQIDYPNIDANKISLEKAWHRLRAIVEGVEEEADLECNICRLKGRCNWCPAESWANYKNLNQCRRDRINKPEQLSLKI